MKLKILVLLGTSLDCNSGLGLVLNRLSSMRFTFYSHFFGLGMSVDHVERGPPKKNKNSQIQNPKRQYRTPKKNKNSQIPNPKRQYMFKAPKIEIARLSGCTESFSQPLHPYTCIIKTIGFLEPKWFDTGNSEGIIRPSKKMPKLYKLYGTPEIYSWRTGAWKTNFLFGGPVWPSQVLLHVVPRRTHLQVSFLKSPHSSSHL